MERIIYDKLLKWKSSVRRKPLILEGVRQCGKTYILKKFGKENFSSVLYLNFEEDPSLMSLFEHDLYPDRIISDLKLKFQMDVNTDTLMIFDEIQCCGKALTSLKYFQENAAEYHVVCAGSLLGLLHSTPTSFPVGKVNFLKMYPLSFPEFVAASGRSDMLERSKGSDVPETFRKTMDELYREYCFVGGMPDAVLSWLESKDPERTRTIQSDIVRLYQSDFAKYASAGEVKKLSAIWSSIPEQLSRENKKFIFSHAVEGKRARDLEDALQWLIDAGIVMRVKMISKPGVPLSAYSSHSNFKLYCSDIGLLGAMAKISFRSIMLDDNEYAEFKGAVTENYVLTELVNVLGDVPYCWRSEGKAEIDFVAMVNDMILPIEVKSGSYRRLQSMEVYSNSYIPEKMVIISAKWVSSESIVSIPLPMVWKIKEYV